MHYQRLEGAVRALDYRLFAFNQVQNIDTPPAIMVRGAGEPVPTGFDELELVETSTLLTPARTLAEQDGAVDEGFH